VGVALLAEDPLPVAAESERLFSAGPNSSPEFELEFFLSDAEPFADPLWYRVFMAVCLGTAEDASRVGRRVRHALTSSHAA